MNTIALTADTAPTRAQSRIRSVFSRSRPQSSALTISAPRWREALFETGGSPCGVWLTKGDFAAVTICLLRHLRTGVRRLLQVFRRMWSEPLKELPEPLHLFPTVKPDQFLGDRPFYLPEPGPGITCSHREASQRDRRSFHLIDRPKRFPEWMVSDRVVLHSIFESRFQNAGLSCAHLAVMPAKLFGERPSLPPLHSRGDDGDMVN